jgi:iron complex transport system substrate-binding protein
MNKSTNQPTNKLTHLLFLLCALLVALVACSPAVTPTTAPTAAVAATPTRAPATSTPIPATPPVVPTNTPIPPTPTLSAFPVTITDGEGRKVTLAKAPQKIISLAPSNTEILFALGLKGKVIAVDHFSDYPADDVKGLPQIDGMKPNFEQIVTLNPELVLAASITSADNIKKLEELKLTVIVIGSKQTTIEGVMKDIQLVGQVTGASDRAKQVTSDMQKKLDALKAKVAATKTKPKVFWELDGTNPAKPFSVGPGSFVNDLITLAGGENVFANANSPYAQVGAEQVVGANPDVIIMSDVAYGVSVESLKARAGWSAISAVKNNKVFPIDDNLVSRPGPRIVDGLEAALKLIHPELY